MDGRLAILVLPKRELSSSPQSLEADIHQVFRIFLSFAGLLSPRRVKLFRQRRHLECGRLQGRGRVVRPQHRSEPLNFHLGRGQGVASLPGFVLRVLRRTLSSSLSLWVVFVVVALGVVFGIGTGSSALFFTTLF